MKVILLLLSVLTMTACGTGYNSSGNTNVSTPQQTSITMMFANHGEVNTSQNLYTNYRIVQKGTLLLPTAGVLTSWNASLKPVALTVTINNSVICTYLWDGKKYTPATTCQTGATVVEGDLVGMIGYPQGHTVTVPAVVQK